MTKISETILFFGSGPVAARSLELLLENFAVEAVVTKPRPAHHKGDFPVLEIAEQHSLTVLPTTDQTELSALFNEYSPKSRVGLVIDYGILVPGAVIDRFPLGIINSHFSLLPRWRGADPISFAILNGDKETGVSLMLIDEALDEGPLLAQQSLTIPADATTPSLTDNLIDLSNELLIKTLPPYLGGALQPYPQPSETPTYSQKLSKADGVLDWHKPAAVLEREVRAFAGWPRSRARLGSTDVIVTKAHVIEGRGEPGKVSTDDKQLAVQTADSVLIIDSLIPAGKKEMSAQAFLAGYQV
jgi:methionyl-tRNA formyltransferase